jgi:hypothetical protein
MSSEGVPDGCSAELMELMERGRRYVLGGTHSDDLYRKIGAPQGGVTRVSARIYFVTAQRFFVIK